MSDYRDDLRAVSKDAPYTAWTFLKWGVLAVLVIAVLVFLAQSLGIISMDISRETVQHSQGYTETKESLLMKLHSDWTTLDAEIAELKAADVDSSVIEAKQSQQKAIVTRIKIEAGRIPSSQLPPSIQSFLSDHK
ncbi:hypothetical protein HQ571_00595 [Candidatus Kuenenbacteria bacterium]|nr:hypothetical protein [Candidatus Kuenenbacteria bacterium]